MSIGLNIKAMRKSRGLTQKQLAERMGVSPQMISMYENGDRLPKSETIKRIADALDCSVDTLFPAIEDFETEIKNRIELYKKQLETCVDDSTKENLEFKINLLKRDEWSVFISQQTDELYVITPYFRDILKPYLDLNATGKREAEKRVRELSEIEKYKKKD